MSVDLVPEWTIGSLCLTSYPFGVDADSNVDIGEPAMVVESVTSSLADGDLERVVRHGNRTYVIPLYIEGATLGELAEAEALLRAEIKRTGLTLTHDPGDGFSPASVYEVSTAALTPERKDDHESHLVRRFTLSLTCSPFARSAEIETVSAFDVPATENLVTIDTCDSATGWTGFVNTNPVSPDMAWAPGAVSVHELLVPGGQTLALVRTGAVDFSATRYLKAEIGYNHTLGTVPVECVADGTRTLRLVNQRLISAGRFLYTFDTEGASATTLKFSATTTTDVADLKIWNLARTDMPPAVTPRQASRIIHTGGTERTPCSLRVNPAAGEEMGIGIVHTSPESGAGYSPALRQRRLSGNPLTVSSARVSGASEGVLPNPIVATIPLTSLPEDGYSLVALMRSSLAGVFPMTYTVRTFFNGNYIGSGETSKVPATFNVANEWTLVPLGNVTLPPVRASQEASVQIDLSRTVVGAEVIELDEWWAFRMGEDCALTMVQSPRSFLWLDAPDASSPVPRVWVGNNGDRTDAHHPAFWLINQGNHVMHPDGTSVFVASTGILNPTVTAWYYKRWHSNAAE